MTRRFCGAALAGSLLLAGRLAAQGADPDTLTYRDAATEALVARARARHLRQDSLVRDYRADVTTRLDFSVGRSRFAAQRPLLAHETRARVTWRQPNDLRVEVLGKRTKWAFGRVRSSRGGGVAVERDEVSVSFEDRPWFVPRALGDSIRLLGFPETAALHPLSPGAERWYRYAISDSVTIERAGRTLRAIGIRVVPRTAGPSLVAGDLWVDAGSADVVRLMVTFVGDYVWEEPDGETPEDSAEARKDNRRAQRFLTVEADLEYLLVDDRYWMPYRQLLGITAEIDFLLRGAAPLRFVTTFSGYAVNESPPITFLAPAEAMDSPTDRGRTFCPACPDGDDRHRRSRRFGYVRAGTWADGRWEVQVPPAESLASYPWRDSLSLDLDPLEAERIRQTVVALGKLAEQLPADLVARAPFGLAWDEMGGIVRFNRVQGASVGGGLQIRPGFAFTTLDVTARFGFSDERLLGSAIWRRDAPGGGLEVTAYRAVLEAEPWTRGLSLGNTLNAVFAGHDDADYYLADWGGAMRFTAYHGSLRDVDFTIGVERHASMATTASSGVNDVLGGSGVLLPNPPAVAGTFARASISPSRRVGSANLRLGVEALVGEGAAGGRGWVSMMIPFHLVERRGAVTLRTGYAVGDNLPQLRLRAGGPHTVRGYDYGTRVGRGVWSAQLDYALTRSWLISPVVFADAGDTYRRGTFDPLVGLGGGVSLLGGFARLNASWGVNPETGFRFDLLFRAPR